MRLANLLTLLLAWVSLIHAQTPSLDAILSFETTHTGSVPAGWNVPPKGVYVDDQVVHSGKWSVRLEPPAGGPESFVQINRSAPMDFAGSSIELRGFLRTQDVGDFAGLWMREDGAQGSQSLAFDNMQRKQLKGTTEWTEYSITLPVNREGRTLFYGVLCVGGGKAWADDLKLLVDGKPIGDAPKAARLVTALDSDHEFDNGSKINFSALTLVQVTNLETLAHVWGFLKYHHPAVVAGKRHWDYDLFRVMPVVLAATGAPAANEALLKWIRTLGEAPACKPCAQLETTDLYMRPRLDWIRDETRLGAGLSRELQAIYANRPATGKQFYLSFVPGVKNPQFENEPAYAAIKLPDAGYQLLALFREWNIIQYWSPYRDLLGDDWDRALPEFISRIALAKTAVTYHQELMAFIARARDTHANLWSSIPDRPPIGPCWIPIDARFIDNRAVVSGFTSDAGRAMGFKLGDVVEALDGVPIAKLVAGWEPYYAASNQPARLRDIARPMTRGACGDAAVRVSRDGAPVEIAAQRMPWAGQKVSLTHDLAGDAFRRLSDDVGYLKLSAFKIDDAKKYIDSASGTKGLIIDIRNYPSEFAVFALGSLLASQPTNFTRFTVGDASNPGAFHWTAPLTITPAGPHYAGKVVILIDEISQSQAEYTTMALRAAGHATVVGSTTAGADGNVSQFALPGGLSTMISGIGVFYPDNKPTQQIGILSDVNVQPTIAGIRDGRDEVLEEGVRQILGKQTPIDQIQKMIGK